MWCGICAFWDGSAPLGWKGRAVFQSEYGAIPAGFDRFRRTSRRMEPTTLDRRTCSRNMRRQVCGLRRRFRRALEEGQSAADRGDVSRETFLHSGRLTPIVPLFFVILRSLRRRISARGGWVGLEAGRFFADSTTASVRQNDNVKTEWDVRRPV